MFCCLIKTLNCVQPAFRVLQPTAWWHAGGTARLRCLVFDAVRMYSISEGQVSCIFRGMEGDVNTFLRKVWYLSARIQDVIAVTSNTLRYCCSMPSRLHPAVHVLSVHLCSGLRSFYNISIHLSHGIFRTRALSGPYTSSWILGWLIQIWWAPRQCGHFWEE